MELKTCIFNKDITDLINHAMKIEPWVSYLSYYDSLGYSEELFLNTTRSVLLNLAVSLSNFNNDIHPDFINDNEIVVTSLINVLNDYGLDYDENSSELIRDAIENVFALAKSIRNALIDDGVFELRFLKQCNLIIPYNALKLKNIALSGGEYYLVLEEDKHLRRSSDVEFKYVENIQCLKDTEFFDPFSKKIMEIEEFVYSQNCYRRCHMSRSA